MDRVTPIYSAAKSLSYLRELIADSTMWQAMVLNPDAAADELVDFITTSPTELDRDAAVDAISIGMFPTDADGCDSVMPVPRILLRYDTDGTFEDYGNHTFRRNQNVLILIETWVPPQWRERSAVAFSNQELDGQDKVFRILQQCVEVMRAGTAERLIVDRFTIGPHGLIAPEDANGDWIRTCEIHAEFQGAC